MRLLFRNGSVTWKYCVPLHVRVRSAVVVDVGMQTAVMGEMKMETETEPVRPKVTDSRGVLRQNREFLDYFWDIAKPERETRLRAVERLIEHVKKREQVKHVEYSCNIAAVHSHDSSVD